MEIKVLSIGQLPTEVGGSYTTGIANVVYELSKQQIDGIESFVYSTNAKDEIVSKFCSYPNQYMGYRVRPFAIFLSIICHPITTYKEWKHYKRIDHRNPLRFEFYKDNFKRAIDSVNPDLIHIHGDGLSPLYFANKKTGIPIIKTFHGVFYRGDANDVVNRDRHLGNIGFIDYATGLTSETHEEITKILGFTDESRIAIIPNGIDVEKVFYSTEDRKNIRKELNVSEGQIVFVTMASVQERKGQFSFVKFLEKTELDFQYWIIGKGNQLEEIKEYIEKRGVENRVKLLGYRDNSQLYQYYSAADIYAHPSTKEGQALSEIEAFTTGLRTVVNKLIQGTVIGDVNDKYHYHVVDFDNPDIEKFVEWIKYPTKERQTCAKYNWSAIAEEYGKLYKRIHSEKTV